MRTRQHLWRVGVQGSVVDVETEVDETGKDHILVILLDSGVAEEERAGDESTDHHGVFAAQDLPVAHESSKHRAEDTARISKGVVAPRLEIGTVELRAAGGQVLTSKL